jgi:D-cysteine desulfhydrase
MTGNKVRKLEFLLADARRQRCDTVITCGGVQSNHARTTAAAAATLGLKCALFLRGSPDSANEANLLLDHVVGAEVHFLGVDDYVHRRDEIMRDYAEELARQDRKAYVICEGGSNSIGTWGYVRALHEIYRQVRRRKLKVTGIAAAVGSGGTHSGLLLGTKLLGWRVPVYGINICDNRDYFVSKIGVEIQETIAKYKLRVKVTSADIRVIDGYVGEGYAMAAAQVHDLIRSVATESGIVLEPVYTGKAFFGMLEEMRKGTFGKRPTMIFVHTGGVYGLLNRTFADFYSS